LAPAANWLVATLPLAGVLLGKTSLNSLYGGQDQQSQSVPRFGSPDSARISGTAAAPNEYSLMFFGV
jgi:hypothetical protein